jgi:pSer/pThr/pTyr-binding forkhead associated (FHA) protein
MPCLIVAAGPEKGKFYPLGTRTNVIGRDEGVPIQLVDPHISRKHAQIRFDKEKAEYHVLDMKSRHGVFVNNVRLKDEVILKDNDVLDIGGITLMFTLQDFADREGALAHYRKTGERFRQTMSQ